MGTISWTEADVSLLRELKAVGWSAGGMVARFPGKTRNAIIGKLNRLGLKGGGKKPTQRPQKRPQKHERMWRQRDRAFRPPAVADSCRLAADAGESPKHVKLIELTQETCRWPYGVAAPYTFCGCQRAVFSSYCERHHVEAHVAPADAEARAKAFLLRTLRHL